MAGTACLCSGKGDTPRIESKFRQHLVEAPVMSVCVGSVCSRGWGRVEPRFGIWLQAGVDAFMWLGVILGWIGDFRLRMTLRKVGR